MAALVCMYVCIYVCISQAAAHILGTILAFLLTATISSCCDEMRLQLIGSQIQPLEACQICKAQGKG